MHKTLAFLLFATVAAAAQDWPCFHGAKRDNQSAETGLLASWPEGGPKLLWTADVGHGYSSVAVAGGRLFTSGMVDKDTYVVALDLDGKVLWKKLAGEAWQAAAQQQWAIPYAGARATPTVDGDTVYFLAERGKLQALAAATGEERWAVDVAAAFGSETPKYGYTESVLIDGDRLFCCPGGKQAYAVALDKRDGRVLWTCPGLADPHGSSSFVVAEVAGARQLVNLTAKCVFAVGPDDGALLWQFPFANKRGNNITDVVVHDGLVFAATGYGTGCVLLRPKRGDDGKFAVEKLWESKLLDNHHGGVVLHDGHLYGSGNEAKGWFCLEFATGKQCWNTPGKGSLTFADGHLYCLDENGRMALVRATPEKYDEVSSFAVPKGARGLHWPHPVVCGGRLYVRHAEKLHAYQIKTE